MSTQMKVVPNPTPGGQRFAVQLPDAMASDEWRRWLASEENRKKIKKGKRFMKANPKEDEYVVQEFPKKGNQPIPRRDMAEFTDQEKQAFVKKTRGMIDKGMFVVMFLENDPAWNSGFLEFLIDRFEYEASDRFSVMVYLEKPKPEGGLYA